MKSKLMPNFEIDSRKIIASKFIVVFSSFIMSFFTVYTYINASRTMFLVDSTIFFMLLVGIFFLVNKNILLLAKIVAFIVMFGLVAIVYVNKGQDNVFLWTFVGHFYFMFLFGHKKGLIYASIFAFIIFVVMFNYIGESITYQGYVRFVAASITLIVIAFIYEYSIETTLLRLENVRKDLEKMVKTDSLTKLFNRRYFDEIFPQQIKIAKRNRRLLGFAMVDIDDFKKYNDTYGHQAGDEVLREISQSFKDSMQRPDDYVFRLGGEEFGLLFQIDNRNDGLKLVEDICKSIELLKIGHSENSISPYVTVSVGLYVVKNSDNYDYDDIFKKADDALYSAKLKGKNRVEEL